MLTHILLLLLIVNFYIIKFIKLEKKIAKNWKVEKHPDNTYSFICEMDGKHYHLCCHSFYPTDERDAKSKYVLAHTDSN